jgi:hypothetical protein
LAIREIGVIVCGIFLMMNDAVTSGAAEKVALPGWLAARMIVPTEFGTTAFPLRVAGPDFTLKTTGRPEEALGRLTEIGVEEKFLFAGAASWPKDCRFF